MKEWAHHIRLDANEATHEVEDFSEEDAKKLQVFTEMFLTYCIHSSGDAETSQRGGVLGWLIALLCLNEGQARRSSFLSGTSAP